MAEPAATDVSWPPYEKVFGRLYRCDRCGFEAWYETLGCILCRSRVREVSR